MTDPKRPGLPEEVWIGWENWRGESELRVFLKRHDLDQALESNRTARVRLDPTARYVRAPDPEGERLREAVVRAVHEPGSGHCDCCHMIYWDGLTPDDPAKDTYVHEAGCPVGALEAWEKGRGR